MIRQIKFMGLGVQVDVFRERMTDTQLGIFCLVGAVATFCIAYLLTALAKKIGTIESKLLRAVLYYITIALLLPEWAARIGFGVLLVANGLVFWKQVLPVYSRSFSDTEVQA